MNAKTTTTTAIIELLVQVLRLAALVVLVGWIAAAVASPFRQLPDVSDPQGSCRHPAARGA